MIEKAIERAKKFEGFSPTPYICPAGKITIGYGLNLERGSYTNMVKDIIGRALFNAVAGGCSISKDWSGLVLNKKEASYILQDTLLECLDELKGALSWFENLPEPVQLVLLDMCYNMGLSRLLKFRNMLYAAEHGNWLRMSDEMLDSKWAGQVGPRATKQAAEIAYLPPDLRNGDL